MPYCPHCKQRVEGGYISAEAAHDIISQRDLLKVQKAGLKGKIERQAAWIERLERRAAQMKKEVQALRKRLEEATGRGWFEKESV